MKSFTTLKNYFSKTELILWSTSVVLILIAFCLFDRTSYMTLWTSLIGVTSLIFCAKGNPMGQLLMVLFSLLYGMISLNVSYYGEMITYLGMTMPMAVFSLITWLKNPFNGNRSEVEIYHIKRHDIVLMSVLTAVVTILFYFILKAFNTANLIPSTISVTTSFLAVYLTFKRSPYYCLLYTSEQLNKYLCVLYTSQKPADPHNLPVFISIILISKLSWFQSTLSQAMCFRHQ